ncbi:hypothetical protein BGX27_001297, partial [Mortierella sp. AM989]
GASGCGKSTLGNALAKSLNIQFLDGDDLHPTANIEKMASGHPLTDVDRYPWLALIRTKAEQVCQDQLNNNSNNNNDHSHDSSTAYGAVIACSALKKVYRDILRGQKTDSHVPHQSIAAAVVDTAPSPDTLPTYFVYLKGTREALLQRMEKRKGHFMKSIMLDSQLQILESPEGEEGVVVVSIDDSPEEQIRCAREGLSSLAGSL